VTRPPQGRGSSEPVEVDALVTDRYLDSLLAAHARGADHEPIPADSRPDRAMRRAADQLSLLLPRLHPSFRFEEALTARLQDAAARMRLPLAAGAEGAVVPIPARLGAPGDDETDGEPFEIGPLRLDTRPPRPLLIGGALTSAALSIAGAAYVAWRIRHPQAGPMARAVRAVAKGRLA
jgi:hypothetical protein